ncbi:hypothetical protein ACQKJ1_24360 [Methylorubrum rhodesianum]|uniref:hypothetical protein n=1 Tax=Methylorubrum rhodesianum TaxID=29427 RepID=UPI003D04E4A6
MLKCAFLAAMGEMRRVTDAATLVAAAAITESEMTRRTEKRPKPDAQLTCRTLHGEDFKAMPPPPRH